MATEEQRESAKSKIWEVVDKMIVDNFDANEIIGVIELIKLDLHFTIAKDTYKRIEKAKDFENRKKKD